MDAKTYFKILIISCDIVKPANKTQLNNIAKTILSVAIEDDDLDKEYVGAMGMVIIDRLDELNKEYMDNGYPAEVDA